MRKYASVPARANPYRHICNRSCSRAPPCPCPCPCPWPYGSSDDREQPVPAHRQRPTPELPCALTLVDREENDLRFADDILNRHHANLAEAAVGGIVAIVTHHEIMVGRHCVDLGVVGKSVVHQ